MASALPILDSMFASIQRQEVSLAAKLDPQQINIRFSLVKDLITRLPHKYLPAATKVEIRAAGRIMMMEGRSKAEMKALQGTLLELFDHMVATGVIDGNQLRGHNLSGGYHQEAPEIGLAVGLTPERTDQIRRILGPMGLSMLPEATTRSALDKMGWFPFSFVVCAFPIDAPARFLETLRSKNSLCRSTGVVFIASDRHIEKAKVYEGRGANQVIAVSAVGEELADVHARLAMVSERVRIRVPVHVDMDGGNRSEAWRCENISLTGMLLKTSSDIKKGQEVDLEFKLPGDDLPLHVSAEIVRSTTFGREEFTGLGIRFLSFLGEDQHRMELFLRRSR